MPAMACRFDSCPGQIEMKGLGANGFKSFLHLLTRKMDANRCPKTPVHAFFRRFLWLAWYPEAVSFLDTCGQFRCQPIYERHGFKKLKTTRIPGRSGID